MDEANPRPWIQLTQSVEDEKRKEKKDFFVVVVFFCFFKSVGSFISISSACLIQHVLRSLVPVPVRPLGSFYGPESTV